MQLSLWSPYVLQFSVWQSLKIKKKQPFLLWAEPKPRLCLCSRLAASGQVPCTGASVMLWQNLGISYWRGKKQG